MAAVTKYRGQIQSDQQERDSKPSQDKGKITIQVAPSSGLSCSDLCSVPQRILSGAYNAWQLRDPTSFHLFSMRSMTVQRNPRQFELVKTMQVAWKKMCFVTDPWVIHAILQENRLDSEIFGNPAEFEIFNQVFHSYALSPPAKHHKALRQHYISSLMNNAELKKILPTIRELSRQIISKLKLGEEFNISKGLATLTIGVVLELMCKKDVNIDKVFSLIDELSFLIEKKAVNFFFQLGDKPGDIKNELDKLLDVENICETTGIPSSFKEKIIRFANETFAGQDKEKREYFLNFVCGFLFAGTENSRIFGANMLNLLGHFPRWQDALEKEYAKAQTSSEPDWLLKYLNNQDSCLHRVFLEAIRLNPPSFANARLALQDIEFYDTKGDFHRVAKGTNMFLMHYLMGRDSQYWGEDSDSFNPDRFKDEFIKLNPSPDSIVFANGPTSCPGKKIAEFEVNIFILELLMHYRWTSNDDFSKLDSKTLFNFKPNDNIKIIIKPK